MAQFELDKHEKQVFAQWDHAHLQAAHGGEYPYAGAIGGHISFIVSYTGLGMVVSAECFFCKDKELPQDDPARGNCCLTDFSNW